MNHVAAMRGRIEAKRSGLESWAAFGDALIISALIMWLCGPPPGGWW